MGKGSSGNQALYLARKLANMNNLLPTSVEDLNINNLQIRYTH